MHSSRTRAPGAPAALAAIQAGILLRATCAAGLDQQVGRAGQQGPAADVCPGSPFNGSVPTGYESPDPNCTDMLYQQRCNISCSSGYTDNGIPVQRVCRATSDWPVWGPVVYDFHEGSGRCTEMSCDADSVPDMGDVISSSSCVGTAHSANCSPVCDVSYELVEPIKCTKGQFDEIPLVCLPTEHAEALELVEVLLIRMAIASDDPGSAGGLTAAWAAIPSSEAAIKGAIGKILGAHPGQIFIKGKKNLNSDWSSVTPAARRLTTPQGLFFEVVLQPTELVNSSTLHESISGLAEADFTDELARALQNAGGSVPSGLETAEFHFGPIEIVSFTLPVARWVARTDWSLCDTTCGDGVLTRTVECVGAWGSSATDLCNANAGPAFTKEGYMPDSEPCRQFTTCPYDWTCPNGPDPISGKGCEGQASGVAIALAVAFLCCCCLLGRFLWKRWLARNEEKADVEGTREEEVFSAPSRRQGCAYLTPRGGRGDPIGPVDLDFSGAVDFELQLTVITTAKDSLLLGKVYRRGDATLKGNGEAKALTVKQGFPAWQVGEDTIYGKTYIADGEPHEISISYSGRDGQYVLKVDRTEEAQGIHGVADSLDTSLVLGSASAPRDDTFNALYPLLEELRRAGVVVSHLEDRLEDCLFDGDIGGLIWRECRWCQEEGRMDWFVYGLRIGAEGAIDERMTRHALVSSASAQLFHKGQTVEHWSNTVQTWMPAEILDATDPCYDDTLKLHAPSFDVYVGAASQTARGVGMMDLRAPFAEGESVSVFSQKHGGWFPARIHGSRHASDPRRGYDIQLEDVLEEYTRDGEEVQTYFKSELQKDLAMYKGVPGQDDEPLLKKMTAKRLRRRFKKGERVLLYQGTNEGFVEAEVVREEAAKRPWMENVAVATPSPATPDASSDDGYAQRKARRYNFSDQRHAQVVVRRIRSGSTLPQEAMRVPEYALRRLVSPGSEGAPPGRSSPSDRGAEDAFDL